MLCVRYPSEIDLVIQWRASSLFKSMEMPELRCREAGYELQRPSFIHVTHHYSRQTRQSCLVFKEIHYRVIKP